MTLAEYHKRPDLMEKIGLVTVQPEGRKTVFVGLTVVSYPFSILEEDPSKMQVMNELEEMVLKNPLKYFVPQNQTALLFLNDRDHNFKGFVAGNGVGKTTVAWIDVLLDIIPCDPEWPIFKHHGVHFRKYKGPRKLGGVGVVSYEWNNHKSTIWPQVVRRWTPPAAMNGGTNAEPNWQVGPKCDVAGTPVHFMACSQSDTVFESSALDIYLWDEQGEEPKFNGANARIRRRNGRHIAALTPHRIRGRPDTGANSYVHRMYRGDMTAGLKVKFYKSDIFDLPDWIFSERSKFEARREWETEPFDSGNILKLREGRARLYGEFHEGSDMVFKMWTRAVHVIEPFDIPKKWPRYRAIDHGRVNPCASIKAAVSPEGDVIFYGEYYEKGRLIHENAKGVVEFCGNALEPDGFVNDLKGMRFNRFREKIKVPFRKTVLDSRCFGKSADNTTFTIGELYGICGLRAEPANGQRYELTLPIVEEYLRVDPERTHRETGQKGAPKLYVFSTMHNFIREIESFVNEETVKVNHRTGSREVSESPKGENDHLMTCMVWLCMLNLVYIENFIEEESEDGAPKKQEVLAVDPITGY